MGHIFFLGSDMLVHSSTISNNEKHLQHLLPARQDTDCFTYSLF